jgi:hypothetical protein
MFIIKSIAHYNICNIWDHPLFNQYLCLGHPKIFAALIFSRLNSKLEYANNIHQPIKMQKIKSRVKQILLSADYDGKSHILNQFESDCKRLRRVDLDRLISIIKKYPDKRHPAQRNTVHPGVSILMKIYELISREKLLSNPWVIKKLPTPL